MTVADAIRAGYRLQKIGKAWLLTFKGKPLTASWRVGSLLGLIECHHYVNNALRGHLRLT